MSEIASVFSGDIVVVVSIGDAKIVNHTIPQCSAAKLNRLLHYVELGCAAPSRRNRRVKRKED